MSRIEDIDSPRAARAAHGTLRLPCAAFAAFVASVASVACSPRTPAPRAVFPGPRFLSFEARSEMGGGFVLVGLTAELDGQSLVRIDHDPHDPDASAPFAPIPTPLCLGRSTVPAGAHHLAARFVFAGNGYGIFSYLRAYRFPVASTRDVELPADAPGLVVTASAFEKADVAIEDRPQVRWTVAVASDAHDGCVPR